jgi:hypothetical protein
MKKTARNQTCPCGSGKKFKSCCGTGDKTRSGVALGRILGFAVVVVVVVGSLIVINRFRTADLSADAATPEPWEYNATLNQHYNPLPGHEHWHQGPPPQDGGGTLNTATVPVPLQQAPATPDDGSPEPWDYDAVNDKHWNPVTKTWEAGMPPIEAYTSGAN